MSLARRGRWLRQVGLPWLLTLLTLYFIYNLYINSYRRSQNVALISQEVKTALKNRGESVEEALKSFKEWNYGGGGEEEEGRGGGGGGGKGEEEEGGRGGEGGAEEEGRGRGGEEANIEEEKLTEGKENGNKISETDEARNRQTETETGKIDIKKGGTEEKIDQQREINREKVEIEEGKDRETQKEKDKEEKKMENNEEKEENKGEKRDENKEEGTDVREKKEDKKSPENLPISSTSSALDPLKDPGRFRFIHSRKRISRTGPVVNTIPARVRYRHDPAEFACPRSDMPFVLALIMTGLKQDERRGFIRETWAHPDWYPHTRLRAVFVVGSTEDENVQNAVEHESRKHGDIVQYNFIDSYSNLTYKTISMLTWAVTRCPDVLFLAKVDDDVLINPFHLTQYLQKQLNAPPKPLGVKAGDEVMTVGENMNVATTYIYGRYDAQPYPLRTTKWALTMEEYPEKFFPPFVHGPAYIVGMEAAKELMKFAPYVPFVKLEDVYTTGLVAHVAGVKHVQIFREVSTFKAGPELYNGTQGILEESGINTRQKAWQEILKYAPKKT